jgi:hypothetical protein|tara:strand:- start:5 stop:169 length:165 start_codon:yes stop_codon:yes gene_type:complete
MKKKIQLINKLKNKIYHKQNRLEKDAPYISNKTYNKDSKEIAEMKKELSELIKD